MRKRFFQFTAISAATLIVIFSCISNDNGATADKQSDTEMSGTISKDSLIKRGNYLVSSIGCDDCHSPKTFGPQGPQLDMEHRLSGYPANRPVSKVDAASLKNGWMLFGHDLTSAVGPWGISFAANITSDSTGIGSWSKVQFVKAMREGKFKGLDSTRPLLPPMPWQNFKNLTDEDLSAIFAFLKSTKPVRNVVPAPRPLATL